MPEARVVEIHRYPVKSMLGERLESIEVREDGLRGDRSWAVRDDGRGGIEGGRKLPALLSCQARFLEDIAETGPIPVPEIELPSGERLRANDPNAAAKLSALASRPLSLWPRLPADESDHYKRAAADKADMLEELHDIFARLPDEPLPDLGKLPAAILTASTLPGTYFDCFPLFLLTTTSLESLGQANPTSQFDVRRFRPNLLLESDVGVGYPENAWVGKRIRVGTTVFSIETECPRCVMTTHALADLPKDPKIMRTLVQENGGNIGVYAAITEPGIVREGDAVEIID